MILPLKIMPYLPEGLWEVLFGWMPQAGECTASSCQIPPTGAAFYVFVGVLMLFGVREAYLRFGGSGDSENGSSDDEPADADGTSSDGGGAAATDGGATETADEYEDVDGLKITPEFDDILEDEAREHIRSEDASALSDPDGVATAAASSLPPHLEDEDIDPEEWLCQVSDLHRRQIAPSSVEKHPTHYRVGDQYRRVLFAHQFPDQTPIAGLTSIVEDPTLHFDLTVHFHANDRDRTLRAAKNLYNNLEASMGIEAEEGDELRASDKALRRKKVRDYRDRIKNDSERPCSVSLYVSVRDEDEEKLLQDVDEIRDEFRETADIRMKTLERKQEKALLSASPIGIDAVHNDDPDIDPTHKMLGGSFGAIMSSLTQSRKFEPTGHEWGLHSRQGHPIVKDPFESPRNYNMVVVGESGSGKSLNMKRMALATKASREDTLIIMLDPLQGFTGMAEALDAEKVTIGGKQNLNPMEIRKPSQEHLDSEAWDEDKDPLSAKIDDVMAFITNYVNTQPGLEFSDESQLLRSLILASYKEKGITHDVETHDNESPTLSDVLDLASHAKENPEKWAKGPQQPDDIVEQASSIGNILREFSEGGQYSHLTKSPEQDVFGDNDVIYLDLSQEESSGGSGTGIMGQLMFSLAYEKCKQYPGPAIYIIDEARFLFREADTLEFLGQRVRHSRHYDTSIRFITQEMDDFFEFPQAEGIVNNSSFEVIHQAPDVDTWGDRFDLKDPHKKFVKKAATGSDRNYSQALVRFPEEDQWYPLTITLGERMLAIADFDNQADRYEELPGRGPDVMERSPIVRELHARIRAKAHSHEDEIDELLADWEKPLWEMLTEDRAVAAMQAIDRGAHPRDAIYTEALDQVEWVIEKSGGDPVAGKVTDRLTNAIQERYAEDYTDMEPEERLEEDETVPPEEDEPAAEEVAVSDGDEGAAEGAVMVEDGGESPEPAEEDEDFVWGETPD